MQRWCSKLRSLAALHRSTVSPKTSSSNSCRLLHACSNPRFPHSMISTKCSPFLNSSSFPASHHPPLPIHPHLIPLSLVQVRHITAKQRKRKLKSRKPMTPIISKVKKIKIKGYSSYKGRFKLLKTGEIRCWREGKRHNAHLKSKKAKRRLRRPSVVPLAYAKVMKKLNFRG